MRATFIVTALENGAQLEDVQKAAGHRDPSTTKLYDRRGYNAEKAARFLRPIKGNQGKMFEQTFKNIDDVLWKEAGCTTELDYTEQTSWIL